MGGRRSKTTAQPERGTSAPAGIRGNVALLNPIRWELSVQCAAILSDNASSCFLFYPAHVKVL